MLATSKRDLEQDYENYEMTWRKKMSNDKGILGKGRFTEEL